MGIGEGLQEGAGSTSGHSVAPWTGFKRSPVGFPQLAVATGIKALLAILYAAGPTPLPCAPSEVSYFSFEIVKKAKISYDDPTVICEYSSADS